MQLTVETPVADVLALSGSKPYMVKLAQLVFERSGVDYYRAFSQFRDVADLAALIEAKRKGVFDFAQCFITSPTGLRFPTDSAAVMASLEHALQEEYDQIDLRALGLVDSEGKELVALSAICPGAGGAKPAKPAEAAEKPKPRAKKPAAAEAAKPAAVKPALTLLPQQQGGRDDVLEQVLEQVTVAVTDSTAVLERLDGLSNDIADGLETLLGKVVERGHDHFYHTTQRLDSLERGQATLYAALAVTNENLKRVFAYLDPVEVLPDLPVWDPGSIADPAAAEPPAEPPAEKAAPAKRTPRKPAAVRAAEQAPAKAPAEQEQAQSTAPSVTYSLEELQAMSLAELQDFADSIGVPGAHTVPFKASLLNRIKNLTA